ncbi:MAG TPA: pilin, partial [Prochlorococcaceae cyanobacterium Fu_MAG_50]|nr:pilin [Prochlorococcaceae cyanobacterium Fu_MAG_50]
DITAVMTDSGPAAAGNGILTDNITLPGGHYQVSRNAPNTGSYYIFTASPLPVDDRTQDYNVMACVDLATGASDVKVGTRDDSADATAKIEAADLTCQ